MDYSQAFSVILPVLDEAERIDAAIERLCRLNPGEDIEVIVVDGNPDGSTLKGITHEGVRKTISKRGRALQMNKGASFARGDVLLFLHADTQLPDIAFEKVRAALRDGAVVGGAFDLGIDSDKRIFRVIEKMASLRSRFTRIPYGDQAIFIRRLYFEEIGGYRDISLMEDVELMRRIKRRGDKIQILPDRVRTSPRRWQREGVLYCTVRNWTLVSLYYLGVSPERLAKFYR